MSISRHFLPAIIDDVKMMKQKLPKNWIVLNSKTYPDRVYYFNVKTNKSSWEEPTEDQPQQGTKKSVGSPKKRKKLDQDNNDNRFEPTTPEHNTPEKEVNARRKLVAKRTLRNIEEKNKEEKETPQMRILREKMLKKKEKINPQSPRQTKSTVKSPSSKSNTSSSSVSKAEDNVLSKSSYTPQMRAILQKIQDRTSKSTSKTKKLESENNVKSKQEECNKPKQLRSKSQSTPKGDQVKVALVTPEIDKSKKKKQDDYSPVEVVSVKRGRRSFKKNLGKERMEKLRRSLISEVTNGNNSECVSHTSQSTSVSRTAVSEKVPNIYKNAEVRLIRLKDRLLKDKNSTNKSLSKDQIEKSEKSSQASVTTVDDLVKQAYDNSFCEEMDWEPLEDEKITFEVQAVRTQLCTENEKDISCNIFSNVLSSPLLSRSQEKKQLYIVIDTNVFLSNIEAIELLKETMFRTYDRPYIVIPWTVIRELDYIKDNNGKTKSPMLCVKAKKAVKYINQLFSSKHPRIIGQTRKDVAKNKEKFSIDCPDDEILQTCLQIHDLHKFVVLLSYDANLCSKAMIHDIETLGRNDPFEKIDYLNVANSVSISPSILDRSEGRLSLNSSTVLSKDRLIAEEIYDDLKNIVRDFLTVIVSKEMHELYGELWEKYVIIKPPWTTVTVLQCGIKHWIAAISESFSRKAESVMKELLQIFKDISAERTMKDVSYIMQQCSDLIQMVNMEKHRDLMTRAFQRIDELRYKYQNVESQLKEQKLHESIGIENDVAERERRAQTAFQYFEAAYTFSRDMCGVAAEAVGMPCSFHYSIPNPLPSPDYVKQIQPELAANINRLLHTLSAIIEQVNDSCVDPRTLNNLHQVLVTFLPETASMQMKFTNSDLTPLDVYCCVQQKIEILKTGLRQLQELSTHFCRLASYRAT